MTGRKNLMAKLIELTKGMRAIVDEDDFDYLNQWKWHYGASGYAVREQYLGMKDGKKVRKTILMHRVLLHAPQGVDVDHKNGHRLDNRYENIRLATRSQNKANMISVKRQQTELPMGITYNPSPRTKQPFMARICKDGKSYFIGNFYNLEDAHKAYLAKKKELFGEFA